MISVVAPLGLLAGGWGSAVGMHVLAVPRSRLAVRGGSQPVGLWAFQLMPGRCSRQTAVDVEAAHELRDSSGQACMLASSMAGCWTGSGPA